LVPLLIEIGVALQMLCYGVVRELAKVCVWRRRANVVDEKQRALCDLDVMVRELHFA
jgi:hydrogenase-4 membrane subunit HyfE